MQYGSNHLVKALHDGYDIVYGDLEEIDREELWDKKLKSVPEDKLTFGLGSSITKWMNYRDLNGGEALGGGTGRGSSQCGSPHGRDPFYKVVGPCWSI